MTYESCILYCIGRLENIVYVGVRRQNFNIFPSSEKFRCSGSGGTADCPLVRLLCSMNGCRKLLLA